MNKATSYIIPLLVIAFAVYFWGDYKQRAATDAIATSETIKQNLSFGAIREKAVKAISSNSEEFSELIEATTALKNTQVRNTREPISQAATEDSASENPYTKDKQEKTLDSFFQEVTNLFGEVSAATIGAFHISKFQDYIEKTVPLLSSESPDSAAEKGDNPYQRLIDDGSLGTVIPNPEDPDAVADYRKAKRENYLSKVR